MKALRFLGKLACCLAVCASLAQADSLQLRNGRHIQGKFIGGTTTAIGFMTSGMVEYFATSDVLVLIFDNSNDSPLSGLQRSPMKGQPPAESLGRANVRQIHTSTQDRVGHTKRPATSIPASRVPAKAKVELITDRQPTLDQPGWPSSP
jgi:hypothetical protein